MRLPFLQATTERPLRQPAPTLVPTLPTVGIAAQYRGARMGGDFYDFAVTPCGRLVFLLLDIAGKRDEALDIAATVQERFRRRAPELFLNDEINQSDALNELAVHLNRAILKAAGVHHAPGFLGCFDPNLGTLSYANAGHTPALLRDAQGISRLEANGLPLGLFGHATYEPGFVVLQAGAALLVVSKGLVESRARAKEFGLERVEEVLRVSELRNPQELCASVLRAVETFTRGAEPENDVTALAMMRLPGA